MRKGSGDVQLDQLQAGLAVRRARIWAEGSGQRRPSAAPRLRAYLRTLRCPSTSPWPGPDRCGTALREDHSTFIRARRGRVSSAELAPLWTRGAGVSLRLGAGAAAAHLPGVMLRSLPTARLHTFPRTLGGTPCHHSSLTRRDVHLRDSQRRVSACCRTGRGGLPATHTLLQWGRMSWFQVWTAQPMLSSSLQRSCSCFFLL